MLLGVETNRLPDPQSYAEAMRAPDAPEFVNAMGRELGSMDKNKVYEICKLPPSARAITARWVWKRKMDHRGKIKTYKVRLVARGFQQTEGIDYVETFAAVVKPASYRILFALSAKLGYQIHQMDVKTAFLNGSLDQPVYMKPPPGMKVPRGHVLKLTKSLYGLKQAPRAWYEKFRITLLAQGWRISQHDPCIFIHDKFQLIMGLWVDDILIAGKDVKKIDSVKEKLSEEFDMTDEGYITQILQRYDLENITPVATPLDLKIKLRKETGNITTPAFKAEYQSKVGSLNYASNGTRPDIAFAVGYVARFCSNPTQAHMDAVHRIYAYLAGTKKKGLRFRKGEIDQLGVCGYVDSDFANCEDSRKSTTGFMFTMAGAPISWSSKRQTTVAQSTMDAEYIAAAEAARDAVWIRNFINDLKVQGTSISTIPLLIDNNSALKLTHNPEFHNRSKHIDVKYHFIREKAMDTKEIETKRVATKDNLADILTKSLPKPLHQGLMGRMGVK
ncbi:hypothetical protein FOPE_00796 [Fonsecaea pedrosoi]|nr:hypothetical protein FOPE_00796 [Fonsecaea pedrosoi]